MQIINSIIGSSAATALHLVVTLTIIVLVLMLGLRVGGRLRSVARDNIQLKKDVTELHDQLDRAVVECKDIMKQHRHVLCRIADHIEDIEPLVPEDFDRIRRPDMYAGRQLMRVEFDEAISGENVVRASVMRPADDRLDEGLHEVELTGPEFTTRQSSAEVTNIRDHQLEGPVDDSIDQESDPLTRALRISKAIGR